MSPSCSNCAKSAAEGLELPELREVGCRRALSCLELREVGRRLGLELPELREVGAEGP